MVTSLRFSAHPGMSTGYGFNLTRLMLDAPENQSALHWCISRLHSCFGAQGPAPMARAFLRVALTKAHPPEATAMNLRAANGTNETLRDSCVIWLCTISDSCVFSLRTNQVNSVIRSCRLMQCTSWQRNINMALGLRTS